MLTFPAAYISSCSEIMAIYEIWKFLSASVKKKKSEAALNTISVVICLHIKCKWWRRFTTNKCVSAQKIQHLQLGIILTRINEIYDENRIIIKYGNIRDNSVRKLLSSKLE